MKVKKNKKITLVLLIILFIIICYFVDKSYLYFKYNISIEKDSYNQIVDSLKIQNSININVNDNYNSTILLDEIKIMDIFNDFSMIEKKNNIIKYRNNDTMDTFIARIDKTYLDMILTDENIKINEKELKQFFSKNNITNDIDLFNYLSNIKYTRSNIFTNIEDMKNNYIINYLVSISMTSGKTITKLEGEYNGFIINLSNGKEVSILKNNKRYIFTFIGKQFTDEFIKEMLNTTIINDYKTNDESITKDFKIIIEDKENCNLKLNEYYKYGDRTVYTTCLDEIYLERENSDAIITLKYYLENVNQTFDRSISQLVSDMKVVSMLKDGGTTIYKKDNYTIIVCNTIDGNKDIYIGNENFKYEQGYCK